MVVGDESIAACAHNNNKDDNKKRRRLMMIVLVYGEIKKNGRGETHISKVESAGRRA
jgi:hypothetical protein